MLYIESSVKELLVNDALRTFPDECCGFLLGIEKYDERVVEEIIVVDNAREGDKRRQFEISASDYRNAEQYADENKLTLLGVYHSHPNHPSVPSEHDRRAAQPFFSYLILSVREHEVVSLQSWRLNDYARFEEEKVLIYENAYHS